MDVLKILNESAEELLPEDLEFLDTELRTGDGYDDTYKAECYKKMSEIKRWKFIEYQIDEIEKRKGDCRNNPETKGVFVNVSSMTPQNDVADKPVITPLQQFQMDLRNIRASSKYNDEFKKYVKNSKLIDADFLDKNFNLFDKKEMNAIISVKQLGEPFLEKYFSSLDHEKIARYQLFSEEFFMKHFSQMDAKTVLEKGKNEWRKKENRSKQLDVFLRLKGVRI